MIKIVVNADDYGLDENRTKAILEAYRIGAITTTTIMPNMPWFDKAVEMAKGTGLLANIGMHLTLTEGFPLTDRIRKCPRFCNADGSFNAVFHRQAFTRVILSTDEKRGIAEEAEAQMAKYRAARLSAMHLDSHHHSHSDWSVACVVMPIAKRMGFKTVRRARDMRMGISPLKNIYKFLVNRLLGKSLRFSATRFGSIDDFTYILDQLADDSVVEVMTHPLYREGRKLMMDGDLMDGIGGDRKMSDVVNLWRKHAARIKICGYGEVK